jgi:hypothetical protein
MSSNRIMSFRSRHYPKSVSPFRIRQEYAMRYYAALLFIVMIGSVLRIQTGHDGVYFGLVGIVLAIMAGNVMAKVELRRSIAEVFFINDGLSIISIEDILQQSAKRSFPLRFTDPTRTVSQIQFNFEDQIITLNKADWDADFDLIWTWLTQGIPDYAAHLGVSPYEVWPGESHTSSNDAGIAPESGPSGPGDGGGQGG